MSHLDNIGYSLIWLTPHVYSHSDHNRLHKIHGIKFVSHVALNTDQSHSMETMLIFFSHYTHYHLTPGMDHVKDVSEHCSDTSLIMCIDNEDDHQN